MEFIAGTFVFWLVFQFILRPIWLIISSPPLVRDASCGDTMGIAQKLSAGCDPNAKAPDGTTALMMASIHGNTMSVSLLVKAGAEVNAKDKAGMTALSHANIRQLRGGQHSEVLMLLRLAGAVE